MNDRERAAVGATHASPLVSVIVVSWNSERFLEACLGSVEAQTYPRVELIVVDNASTDGSVRLVRERFPEAFLIQNTENEGFCAANNAGLKRARGAIILCLNSDAALDPTFLEEATKAFAGDERVGMVAGKVLRFDRRTLDTTGQILTRSRRVLERGYGEIDTGQYDTPCDVFSVCGAVALYRREMIESVSLDGQFFDEDFFAFGEDIDAGWRARNMGWRCRYLPSAVASHYRGGTQSPASETSRRGSQMARRPLEIQAHIVKNRYLSMLKNEEPSAFLINLPFILLRDLRIWAYLIAFSPGTIPIIWSHRGLVRRALEKRRRMRSRAPRAVTV